MSNTILAQNAIAGEKLVLNWLTENTFTDMVKEDFGVDEKVIIATGTLENILIRVKTVVYPQIPFKLSEYEINQITKMASGLNKKAYVAYVIIDADKNLIGEIKWKRLD